MKIYEVDDKLKYIDLLLLADEERKMIDKYISDAKMFVLDDGGVVAEITVVEKERGILEIKNIAVKESFQRRGYGKKLIRFVCEKFKEEYSALQVGTGESPLTLPFYENCGFTRVGVIENFFTNNYSRPIIEDGVLLRDMIILQKRLR